MDTSRPSLRQVHWHGFPGSLGGAPIVSHLLLDRVAAPPDLAPLLPERLALLPLPYMANSHPIARPLPCAALPPPAGAPPAARAALLGTAAVPRGGAALLAVFSQPYKVDAEALAAWAAAAANANATLWVLRHNAASERPLRAAAARAGLRGAAAQARLVFTELLPPAEELRTKALADVLLDTPLFGAHTTGVDALWAGLPLLTAPGEALPARVPASLALGAGGAAAVARNRADYRAVLLRLAASPRARARARAAVRAARGCGEPGAALGGVWRVAEFEEGLEAMYRALWEERVARGEGDRAGAHLVVAARES